MSRAIDRLPTPAVYKEKKVIVIARSRTGTSSVNHALRLLGYKAYHGAEAMHRGVGHMAVFEEALNAKYFGIGKPYGRAEFDKWFAEYDALVEVPAVFLEEIVLAYPEATYLHLERDVDEWYKSIMNSLGRSLETCNRYPMKQLRWVDAYIDAFCSFHMLCWRIMWHGLPIDQGELVLKEDYIKLNRRVKEIFPPHKLHSFKLENGFGWNELCGVLECPVPEVEYPLRNTPARYQQMQEGFLTKAISRAKRKAATLGVAFIVIPAVATSAFYYQQYLRRS